MSKKLYVGNMAFSTTEDELRTLFEKFGAVTSVKVIADRDTGRPRGFAFVELEDESAAIQAVEGVNGTEFGGRTLRVDEAQDQNRGGGGGGRPRR